jgi:hypothetical protein
VIPPGALVARRIIDPIAPTDVGGTLTCRFLIRVAASTSSLFHLWRGNSGTAITTARVEMRHAGANLEIRGVANSGALSPWRNTGFARGQTFALQVRYEPGEDRIDLWSGSDFAGFAASPGVSADGTAPVLVDGNSIWSGTGYDFAVDEWACDGSK